MRHASPVHPIGGSPIFCQRWVERPPGRGVRRRARHRRSARAGVGGGRSSAPSGRTKARSAQHRAGVLDVAFSLDSTSPLTRRRRTPSRGRQRLVTSHMREKHAELGDRLQSIAVAERDDLPALAHCSDTSTPAEILCPFASCRRATPADVALEAECARDLVTSRTSSRASSKVSSTALALVRRFRSPPARSQRISRRTGGARLRRGRAALPVDEGEPFRRRRRRPCLRRPRRRPTLLQPRRRLAAHAAAAAAAAVDRRRRHPGNRRRRRRHGGRASQAGDVCAAAAARRDRRRHEPPSRSGGGVTRRHRRRRPAAAAAPGFRRSASARASEPRTARRWCRRPCARRSLAHSRCLRLLLGAPVSLYAGKRARVRRRNGGGRRRSSPSSSATAPGNQRGRRQPPPRAMATPPPA